MEINKKFRIEKDGHFDIFHLIRDEGEISNKEIIDTYMSYRFKHNVETTPGNVLINFKLINMNNEVVKHISFENSPEWVEDNHLNNIIHVHENGEEYTKNISFLKSKNMNKFIFNSYIRNIKEDMYIVFSYNFDFLPEHDGEEEDVIFYSSDYNLYEYKGYIDDMTKEEYKKFIVKETFK